MKKQSENKYMGFGISLTSDGPIFYCFDSRVIDMYEFISLEMKAFIHAKENQNKIFKVFETEDVGTIVITLN